MGVIVIGDTVEVTEGDLIGMRLKLVSMDADANKEDTVKIKPGNTAYLGGMTEVEFLSSQVCLHNLVVLTGGGNANEVGVIVRVGREEFSVMNHHGIVREVRSEELRVKRKIYNNNYYSSDLFSTNTTIYSMNGGRWGASATTNNNSNNNDSMWTPSTNGTNNRDSMSNYDINSDNNTQSQDTYTSSSNSNNTLVLL